MTTSVKITNNGPDKVRVSTLDSEKLQYSTDIAPGETLPADRSYVFAGHTLTIEEVRDVPKAEPTPVPQPTVGRIVLYSYAEHDLDANHKHLVGKIRPAIVVNTWGEENKPGSYFQIQVFTDGSNDGHPSGLLWKTSVAIAAEPTPGKCHWPSRG